MRRHSAAPWHVNVDSKSVRMTFTPLERLNLSTLQILLLRLWMNLSHSHTLKHTRCQLWREKLCIHYLLGLTAIISVFTQLKDRGVIKVRMFSFQISCPVHLSVVRPHVYRRWMPVKHSQKVSLSEIAPNCLSPLKAALHPNMASVSAWQAAILQAWNIPLPLLTSFAVPDLSLPPWLPTTVASVSTSQSGLHVELGLTNPTQTAMK